MIHSRYLMQLPLPTVVAGWENLVSISVALIPETGSLRGMQKLLGASQSHIAATGRNQDHQHRNDSLVHW